MKENYNLCKLLAGHEGETFYSPIFGSVILTEINDSKHPIQTKTIKGVVGISDFDMYGKFDDFGEVMLFPSKEQRDWNVWARKKKSPQKQWISVNDMLPDAYDSVLITSNGSIEIGFHEGGQFYRNTEYAVEKNGKIKGTFLFTPRIFNVTHWMPLPELPTI